MCSVLERTLGVPVLQEPVMQLAVVAAGFTSVKSMCRAMGAWKRTGNLGAFGRTSWMAGGRTIAFPRTLKVAI